MSKSMNVIQLFVSLVSLIELSSPQILHTPIYDGIYLRAFAYTAATNASCEWSLKKEGGDYEDVTGNNLVYNKTEPGDPSGTICTLKYQTLSNKLKSTDRIAVRVAFKAGTTTTLREKAFKLLGPYPTESLTAPKGFRLFVVMVVVLSTTIVYNVIEFAMYFWKKRRETTGDE